MFVCLKNAADDRFPVDATFCILQEYIGKPLAPRSWDCIVRVAVIVVRAAMPVSRKYCFGSGCVCLPPETFVCVSRGKATRAKAKGTTNNQDCLRAGSKNLAGRVGS